MLQLHLHNYFKSVIATNFIKNISIVVVGTVLAQLITISSMPVITRQYGAEALGAFGVFMSIVSLLGTLATGRYSFAVMLPKENNDSVILVKLCFFVTVSISLLSLLILPFSEVLSSFLNTPSVSGCFWILPLMVLFSGLGESLEFRVSRLKMFTLTSLALVSASVTSNAFKLIAGINFSLVEMLLIGSCLGFLIQLIVLLKYFRMILRGFIISKKDLLKMKKLASEYSYLPKFRAPKDFINSLSANAPTIFLAIFFSASHAGFYTLADKMLRIPGQLVGLSVRKVLYQKVGEMHNEGKNISDLLKKITVSLFVVGVIPFTAIIFYGPLLFSIIFGSEWVVAGEYSRWISVWMLFAFISGPSVVIIPILKLEKQFLIYEIISVVLRISCLFYGGSIINNIEFTVISICLIGAAFNVFTMFYIYRACIKERNFK